VTAGVETAAPVAAPVEGEAAPAEVPAEGAVALEGEGEAAAAAKKKTVRAKRPAVKAE
jgi:hypothetical protein